MKRVAVLRGGPSEEYDVSMNTGQSVIQALKEVGYQPKDVIISKQGEWLDQGFVRTPDNILDTADVVFVALHGTYGEDGSVQKIFQRKGLPFTGSRSLPSAIAFNKELTKNTLRPHGIKMPRHRTFTRSEVATLEDEVDQIICDLGHELIVKPTATGSSFGTQFVTTRDQLKTSLRDLSELYERLLIEECIRGREATVGVLHNFRNEDLYMLPAVEIVPPNQEPLFSHDNKYNGLTEELVPGRFSYGEKSDLSDIARLVHKVIDCDSYSRSDFIVRDGEVYFLEINTLPGLTSQSLYPKAADAIGLQFNDLIQHLVDNARA